MPTYRMQTSLQDVSNLPRDQYVTTFHVWASATPDAAKFTEWGDAIQVFWQSISGWLSATVKNGPHNVKMYRVGAPLQTPAAHTHEFYVPGPRGSNSQLPNEVSSCLTFYANPVPGVVRQSWRGRMYIGPLDSSAMPVQFAADQGRPTANFRLGLITAGKVLMDSIHEIDGAVYPVIYSRKRQQVYPIAEVGVDNAWDTQRSRGNRATAMTKLDLEGEFAGTTLGAP